jgi:hypothetical protein
LNTNPEKHTFMTFRILLFICTTALFASCSSSGKVSGDSSQPRLVFGNGGGFTGVYTSYQLDDDGRVYSMLPDSSLQKINRIGKKLTRTIFTQADNLKIALPAFNHPGNITWFLKYKTDDKYLEYKWGDSNTPVPAEIKSLYDQLIKTVK